LYIKCDYQRAEELLRLLLDKNFEVPGTSCHLARILIITERETEAREFVEKAWNHRKEGKQYIIPRVLFFKILFSFLDGNSADKFLSEIKGLLKHESAFNKWKIQPALIHVKDRLTSDHFDFLLALAKVFSDLKELSKLDRFAQWKKIQAKAIENDHAEI
jgi:hypothetical protein